MATGGCSVEHRAVRFGFVAVLVVIASVLVASEPSPAGTSSTVWGPRTSLTLPRSAFNITDHNLTYSTNGFLLSQVAAGSFDVNLTNNLVSSGALPLTYTEAQIGLGPVPAGPEEANITPLIIVQEAASGLLRIEYVPFPMNDTFGYIIFERNIVPAGAQSFSAHVLELKYISTAPGVPPYIRTHPYGDTTGNLTVFWDGLRVAGPSPIAWATFGAFYAYGLKTGAFGSGNVQVTMSSTMGNP